MAKKYFYYVGVQTKDGMVFVTKVYNKDRITYWDKKEKPLAMSLSRATDIAEGLCFNYHFAVVVKSFVEIENHFVAHVEEKAEVHNENT